MTLVMMLAPQTLSWLLLLYYGSTHAQRGLPVATYKNKYQLYMYLLLILETTLSIRAVSKQLRKGTSAHFKCEKLSAKPYQSKVANLFPF